MKKSFKQTVQAMTAKEIIMAMVEGLMNPVTEINMRTFGWVDKSYGDRCYGCAATNMICKIANINLSKFIDSGGRLPIFLGEGDREKECFIEDFEEAIDGLRKGALRTYNIYASDLRVSIIKNPTKINLPKLGNDYTEADLQAYVELANAQES